MRPWIGITMNYQEDDVIADASQLGAKGQYFDYAAVDYIRAIERAGGMPVWLPAMGNQEILEELLDRCDGILVSGGHDMDPSRYGEENTDTGSFCVKRDEQDLFVTRYALEKDKSLLAICRGIQVLNVACGGTLYQDLQKAGYQNHSGGDRPRNEGWHEVLLESGSLPAEIYGKQRILVNSYHHQAVKDLGEGLTIAGVSGDRVTEAIVYPENRFAVGVQWHPEMMYDSSEQDLLFQAFVKSCMR
ncbi:MAG: gamma-glutamyl-gamma-aminobutyrate hydrolase family protein [Solobacterium sp.]|nr:gamma-glutamyl-gamma-aminobutyrate hydrolase family protein [Solobacterium sp.]